MLGKVERKKEIFHRKLKGDPVGEDAFGRPVVEGDILVFSTNYGRSADLRIIKIVETVKDDGYGANKLKVKLKIKRISREWCGKDKGWNLQDRTSFIQKLDNAYLLEDPPQFILDYFEEAEDE